MSSKPLVTNAADEKQLKDAAVKMKIQETQTVSDVRAVMSTKEGRRFVWRLIGHCKVLESIWDNSARIHYNAGKQDVGHFLMAEVVKADEGLYFQMRTESKGDQ